MRRSRLAAVWVADLRPGLSLLTLQVDLEAALLVHVDDLGGDGRDVVLIKRD
jgi:hypothetical protein